MQYENMLKNPYYLRKRLRKLEFIKDTSLKL